MKKPLLFLLLTVPHCTNAQNEKHAYVTGKITSDSGNIGLKAIDVSLPYLKIHTITDSSGIFDFREVKYGTFTLIIRNEFSYDALKVLVDTSFVDIGSIIFKQQQEDVNTRSVQHPGIFTEDNEDGINNQNISGLLSASRDLFVSAAAISFSAFRYQPRGYNREQLEACLNGLQMNDLETGSAFFGQGSGLGDMFRNQQVFFGLQPSENGFGGLSGLTDINAAAAGQQQQTRFTYSVANRTYRNRATVNHSSGLMANGWAYAASFSRLWAKEGYVSGTFYDAYAFYAGISKKLSPASILHFTTFGVPAKRGKASSATLEAMELAGTHFYNPDWGYQNGGKRNAKVNHSFQPIFILNYNYTRDSTMKLGIAISYQTGYSGNSALDWYNAQDPRPDYYQRLPSYYENDPQTANQAIANDYRQKWMTSENYRQVDWDALYAANNLTYDVINGISGKRSAYTVGEDRRDVKKYSFATNLQKKINERVSLSGGLTLSSQLTESYRKMLDLLGGDYYVNLNQFAEKAYPGNSSFNQNDLNNPDGIIKTGDKYSYDYKVRFIKAFVWSQLTYSQRKFDFFLAMRLCQETFQRDGLYKNGLFADDSYGKSQKQSFFSYQLKGGSAYKLNESSDLFANVALMTRPPMFDNTFVSPKTRNTITGVPEIVQIKSMEGGYMLHTQKLKGRLTGFTTDINNATEMLRFYHEDYNTFVNYVMRNVDVRHIGGELALQMQLFKFLSATAAASWMQVFYTSNPEINIYRDNDTAKIVPQSISYLKNTYVGAGPQSAYTLGLNYRSSGFGYLSLNCNYLNRNYINANPTRRTAEAVALLTPRSAQWHAIVDQEILPSAFTIDMSAGRSISLSRSMKWLPKNTFLYINIGVNNLLNNKDIQAAGFEQLRFDLKNNNPERFPTKYIYGYGTNYIVNMSLKF